MDKYQEEQKERKSDLSGSNGGKDKVQSILDGMGMEMGEEQEDDNSYDDDDQGPHDSEVEQPKDMADDPNSPF